MVRYSTYVSLLRPLEPPDQCSIMAFAVKFSVGGEFSTIGYTTFASPLLAPIRNVCLCYAFKGCGDSLREIAIRESCLKLYDVLFVT